MQKAKDLYHIGQKIKVKINAINGHGEGIGTIQNGDTHTSVFVSNASGAKNLKIEITHVFDNYLKAKQI